MDFGKLQDISKVDFSLPPSPTETTACLARFAKSEQLKVYVGCTGWSMKEWVGTVYPPKTKANDYLKAYGQQFNTIELNTTHYRVPDLAIIDRWKAETPADFRFCPKMPQILSHSRDLGVLHPQLYAFCESIAALEEKNGACFLQLPPYFDLEKWPILQRFLEAWPKEIPLAVEFRHESWFTYSTGQRQVAFAELEKMNIGTVITDVAGRRDVLHQRLTSNYVLIRFVGNGLHPSDYSRIDEWVNCLLEWHEQGLENVYFFTHEPDNLLAPQLAACLCEKMGAFPRVILRGPRLGTQVDPAPGEQMSLF
jgi:uncharacterized protein YecE (DUF72 family)